MPADVFHLFIDETAKSSYTVTVNVGDKSATETVTFSRSDAYSKARARLLDRRPGLGLVSLDDQDAICQVIGNELFTSFVTGSVLKMFKEYRKSNEDKNEEPRIGLHLHRSLYREPWEVLKDPDDNLPGEFLSLLGSVVRFDATTSKTTCDPRALFFPPVNPMQCLFVSPKPTPTPEWEAVPEFEPTDSERMVFNIVSPATYSEFVKRAASLKGHGFVFFGHGAVQQKAGHLVFVVLQLAGFGRRPVNDLKSGSAVSDALSGKKNLRLGCVMACETAWLSDEEMDFEKTVAGSLLTKTRIGFVVGAQLKMNFAAAETFLLFMLGAVQDAKPLDLAVNFGRKNVRGILPGSDNAIFKSPMDWWIPVLYAKSAGFDVVAQAPIAMPTLTIAS